jgi:flavocytochrome c
MVIWPQIGNWNYYSDITVVGAGISGLIAAIEAYDNGADVILIEKNKNQYSNASTLCGGNMAMPNWRQKKENILDSPDLLYKDMMKTGRFSNNTKLLRTFVDNVESAYNKLKSFGVESTSLQYQGGHSVKRSLGHNSYDVMKILFEEVKSRGIVVLFNTKVLGLVRNLNENQVIGIFAENSDRQVNVRSRCIILATGGITGSSKMIDNYVPKLRNYVLIDLRNKSSIGEGHKMAMKIGASTSHMYVITTYASGIPVEDRKGLTFFTNVGIKVNKNGERFINEINMAPCEIGEKVLQQPERCCYQLVDYNNWLNEDFYWGASYSNGPEVLKRIKSIIKDPPIFFGETIDELAFNAKINGELLKNTIKKYNQYCENKIDKEFNRPKNSLNKIITPPFVAIKLILIATHGCGGLRTKDNLNVLDIYGSEIKGLFACGEIVGGVSGETYLTATHYPFAMTSGYLAGKYSTNSIHKNS